MLATSSELIADAVNARPLTSKQGILERVFNLSFGGFVYNQIWEDPDVDAAALQLDGDSRVMTISSGGCNVLDYLTRGVASIDAVDLNANHLHLLKLKLHGAAAFPSHADFFAFFGDANDPDNVGRYQQYLLPRLDEAARHHWEGGNTRRRLNRQRFRYFERGLWNYASLGMFLNFMHGIARRKGMRPSRLLDCSTLDEQENVFAKEIAPFFDMRVVRGMCKLPFLLHGIGVPPRQYETFKNEAVAGSVLQEYRVRIKRLACTFPVQTNYFAWQAFGRRYDTKNHRAIPGYLEAENFPTIKANVSRVSTHLTSMTGFLATRAPASLNRYVMLDAQDWMTSDQINALWRQVHRTAQPGAQIIFRTGASGSPVESALAPELKSKFVYHESLSRELFKKDRSAIYGGFHLYVMN